MKASIASCGVVVAEFVEVDEVLDDESVAAAEAAVVVPPVAAVAAELAVVTAPEFVSACMSVASRPPAGGAPEALCAAPVVPVAEAWVELPIMPIGYCCCVCQLLLMPPMLMFKSPDVRMWLQSSPIRNSELSIAWHFLQPFSALANSSVSNHCRVARLR
jgi:hypothetical protein